jgi:hypothetical protein
MVSFNVGGFREFSEEQLDAVIAAGGSLAKGYTREKLKEELEARIGAALLHETIRKSVRSRASAKEFAAVARTAGRLLNLIGVAIDGQPLVATKFRGRLQRQGHDWARRYFHAIERERWFSLHARAQERRLVKQGNHDKAAELREARERRRKSRDGKRERWRQLHGIWPIEPSPETIQTDEGSRTRVFGEDLALIEAVRGLQRLRTWADQAAQDFLHPAKSLGFGVMDDGSPWRSGQTVLVGHLAEVFSEFFGKRFGISKTAEPTKSGRPAGSVGGPGIRFIQACLEPLGLTMNPDAIEKAWDAYRADHDMGK